MRWTGDEALAAERKEVIRKVVERHYNDMSQGLLMVLAGYAQAAYSKGQPRVAGKALGFDCKECLYLIFVVCLQPFKQAGFLAD